MAGAIAGNISAEATTRIGNIFGEAMRGAETARRSRRFSRPSSSAKIGTIRGRPLLMIATSFLTTFICLPRGWR
jgi:hypothetical protein